MNSISKVLAIVGILLAGAWLIGFAYSYTSVSENTGNTTTSEYVVLNQSRYSFGSSSISINTVTTWDSVNEQEVTVYSFGGSGQTLTIGNTTYDGFRVGQPDELWGTYTGPDNVTTLQNVGVEAVEGFDDLTDFGWIYIIKITKQSDPTDIHLMYWDGDADVSSQWIGVSTFNMDISGNAKYTTELFVAIPQGYSATGSLPTNPIIDDGVIRFVYSSVSEEEE